MSVLKSTDGPLPGIPNDEEDKMIILFFHIHHLNCVWIDAFLKTGR